MASDFLESEKNKKLPTSPSKIDPALEKFCDLEALTSMETGTLFPFLIHYGLPPPKNTLSFHINTSSRASRCPCPSQSPFNPIKELAPAKSAYNWIPDPAEN